MCPCVLVVFVGMSCWCDGCDDSLDGVGVVVAVVVLVGIDGMKFDTTLVAYVMVGLCCVTCANIICT